MPFSAVIICKNEKESITKVLESLRGLTDDVVVYDSGSTDGTPDVVKAFGGRVHSGEWQGFGKTKGQAVALARYDWVLNVDADEALDEELQQSVRNLSLTDENVVYRAAFKNLLGEKHLKWGEWGRDKHIRLFNRRAVRWNDAVVHESLVLPPNATIVDLKGYVLHRTMKDTVEYSQKMVKYALLNAEKYFAQGKRSSWAKRYVSPVFSFWKHYVFRLGFLDGWEGLLSARMTAFYTFLKYARLKELEEKVKRESPNVKQESLHNS